MSMVLAGLATGIGQGIQRQAEFNMQRDEAQRDRDFQSALENLRTQNNIAVDNNRADRGDQSTKMEYGLKDEFEERDVPRKIKVASETAAAEGKVRIEVDNAAAANDRATALALERARSSNDIAKMRVAAEIDRETAAGLIDRIEVSGDGTFVKFYKNGRVETTGVTATPRDIYGSQGASLGGGLFDDPALQGLGGPAQAAPPPARSQPPAAPPARSGGGSGGIYFARTDAQAEAFANNPANKGKSFVGPDGKQYTVQ